MFVVDTNVLIHAANADAPEHASCRDLLEGWRRGASPWYTTWPIHYEFLRVVTHPRVLPRPLDANQAYAFVAAVLQTASHRVLTVTAAHARVLQEVLSEVPAVAGNLFHDVHTAVLMREHGLRRIYTRDADFRRFPFLEVVDPLE
jgi:toxin-antitoxin system PIN domain toxin